MLHFITPLKSQSISNQHKNYEKLTYDQYQVGNWDSLIIVSSEAIKSGYDYYYIRLRLGIAYFQKNNFRKATLHLEKAIKFNKHDDISLEYLYYSYLYVNRSKSANALKAYFSEDLKKKLNTRKTKWVDNIYFETGPTFSNNISKNKESKQLNDDSDYSVQDLYDQTYYFHLGASLTPYNRLSFYAGYSNLNISKLKQIQSSDLELKGLINDGYALHYLYRKKASNIQNSDYTLYQKEAYLNAGIALDNGFLITPAVHLIWANYTTLFSELTLQYYEERVNDTLTVVRANTQQKEESFGNQIYSLALSKSISLYDIVIRGSYSNLNNKDQYQLEGLFRIFPLGNLNLYATTTMTSHWQENENRLILNELIGAKLFSKLWMEGHISIGDMLNYNEKNAFNVYNSGDIIKFRAGVNFIITLTPKQELSLRYNYYNNEGSLYRFSSDFSMSVNQLKYQNHSILGGLKWKL